MHHPASQPEASNCLLGTRLAIYRDSRGFRAYQAAATDRIQVSMRPGLSDSEILRHLARAVALGRCAERCFKVLAAIRAKAEKQGDMPPRAGGMPPQPKPPPFSPTPPNAPPQQKPPPQPQPRSAGHDFPAMEAVPEGGS